MIFLLGHKMVHNYATLDYCHILLNFPGTMLRVPDGRERTQSVHLMLHPDDAVHNTVQCC